MPDTIEDIQRALQSPITSNNDEVALGPEDPIIHEIMDMNARIEAIIDLMTTLLQIREQEYEFAMQNVINFRAMKDEPFDNYLARRRSTLLQTLQSAGLR